jgi:hypothetical protein
LFSSKKNYCDTKQYTGADPGFQVRGGAKLKELRGAEGGAKFFFGISCEKSRFYAQKSYFFSIAEGGAKIFGVFRVKNHDFMPKNHIFFQLRREARKYLGYFV